MIEVKELLNNFNNLLLSNELKKNSVALAISEVVKIKIKTDQIEVKNGKIYLHIKPIYKNEIFLKQNEIFLKLKKIQDKNTPKQII